MTSLMSRADLETDGLSRLDIEDRLSTGVLRRVRRGFYASVQPEDSTAQHLLAVRAAAEVMHPGAVFSYLSAAALHGLPLPPKVEGAVEVTRNGVGGGRRKPAAILHKAPLAAGDVVHIDGFSVTSLERTVVDVARAWPKADALAVVDAALARGADLGAMTERVRLRRSHGNARARWVLIFADGRSESYYESLTRLRFHEQGVPPPELQYTVITPGGHLLGVADFAWPSLGVLGEFDGAAKYGDLRGEGQSPQQVLAAEKRREEQICLQGWWFARFTARDCYRQGEIRRIWEQAVVARRGGLGRVV